MTDVRLEIRARHPGHFPLCFQDGTLFSRRGARLYRWDNLEREPEPVSRLPLPLGARGLGAVRPVERLLRLGISHLAICPSGRAVVLGNKEAFSAPDVSGPWRSLGYLGADDEGRLGYLKPGGRPMRFGVTASRDDAVFVGEYRSNPDRSSVRLFAIRPDGIDVRHVFHEHTIRHIHSVQEDPCTGALWLTTGDYGRESRILRSVDGGRSFETIGMGDQSWRATCLLFAPEAVFWGMDSPSERCLFFRWDRQSRERAVVGVASAPIWHGGANEQGWYAFSSTVEPPQGADSDAVIYVMRRSLDGSEFHPIHSLRKDRLSMRWFQFGLIYFPSGRAPEDYLVFSGNALVDADDTMFVARLRGAG